MSLEQISLTQALRNPQPSWHMTAAYYKPLTKGVSEHIPRFLTHRNYAVIINVALKLLWSVGRGTICKRAIDN
jgi:hypothetical protein